LLGRPVTHVRLLKSELSLQPIHADAVQLLELDEEILHVEFETDPTDSDPPLDLRLLDYFVPKTNAHIPEEFHVGDTWHRYRVIKLWEQDPAPLLAHEGLLPLALLARTEQPEQLAMEVAEKVSTIADEKRRSDLTAAAGILAGLRLDERLAHSLFRKELMMQSVIYREILAEGELMGEKRGKQEGERHGRLTLIQRMLNRRFAFLPKHVKTGLTKLSASQLDRLGEALLDIHSVDELTDWLEEHQA
jgi:predicted transposase YdaD